MVCNMGMSDRETILRLGGPTKLARLLGYKKYGPQRVGNWMVRGIPAQVKIDHPELFLQDIAAHKRGHKSSTQS